MSISEKKFYEICDIMEELAKENPNRTNDYFPTIEVIKLHRMDQKVEEYLPFLAYFSSNPLKNTPMEDDERKEYEAMVKYVKELISKIELA